MKNRGRAEMLAAMLEVAKEKQPRQKLCIVLFKIQPVKGLS